MTFLFVAFDALKTDSVLANISVCCDGKDSDDDHDNGDNDNGVDDGGEDDGDDYDDCGNDGGDGDFPIFTYL